MVFLRRGTSLLVLLATLLAVTGCVLTTADAVGDYNVLRAGHFLIDANAVSFFPYYGTNATSHAGPSTLRSLEQKMSSGDAYTAVLFNVEVNDPSFAGGHSVVIIIGEAAEPAMPGVQLCAAPCAMRGSSLANVPIPSMTIAGATMSVSGTMANGATFLDPAAGRLDLDHDVLIHLPPGSLYRLDSIEREEAVSRTVLLNPTQGEVRRLVRMVGRRKVFLVPRYLRTQKPRVFSEAMYQARVDGAEFLTFSILVLLGTAGVVYGMLRMEVPSLIIARIGGASNRHLWVRVFSFVLALGGVGPAIATLMLSGWFDVSWKSIVIAATVTLATLVLVTAVTGKKFLKTEVPGVTSRA